MSKPEWGTKRQCQSCGTKFYDLRRPLITCPSCGAEVDRESPLKSRRSRASAPKPVPKKTAKPAPLVAAAENGEAVKTLKDANLKDANLGDANLGDANLGDAGLADDIADEAGDDVIEDTSELGDDDVSDVVASPDDDEER